MSEKKLTGRAMSMPQGLAIGALVSLAVTVLVSAVGAHMIASEIISQEQIGYCSIAAILTSTIAGGMTASSKIKTRRLMTCALSGLCYFGVLLSGTALFFGGQYRGVGVTLVIVMIGSLIAALLENRDHRNKYGKVRKKTIR